MGMNFGYFLKLTHEPRWNTLTWTLDYTKNSDFDDNVGHWQVMKHPTKAGWTRVLYSTKVKLFPWIPNIVVKFITTKALVESTTWVKKESEKEAAKQKGTYHTTCMTSILPCHRSSPHLSQSSLMMYFLTLRPSY